MSREEPIKDNLSPQEKEEIDLDQFFSSSDSSNLEAALTPKNHSVDLEGGNSFASLTSSEGGNRARERNISKANLLKGLYDYYKNQWRTKHGKSNGEELSPDDVEEMNEHISTISPDTLSQILNGWRKDWERTDDFFFSNNIDVEAMDELIGEVENW